MQDIDQNLKSDFQDVLDQLHSTQEYQDTMNFKKGQETNKTNIAHRKLDIEDKKLDVQKQTSDNQLKVAKENQTKAELNAKKGKKTDEKKTK
jgi:uncharacterized glyoxalase superfamily protein PhnB